MFFAQTKINLSNPASNQTTIML